MMIHENFNILLFVGSVEYAYIEVLISVSIFKLHLVNADTNNFGISSLSINFGKYQLKKNR